MKNETNNTVPSGFSAMDINIGGYRKGTVTALRIIGNIAEQDMLRTFVCRQALKLSLRNGQPAVPTLLISLKADEEQVTKDILTSNRNISPEDIMHASLDISSKDQRIFSYSEQFEKSVKHALNTNVNAGKYEVIILDGIDELFSNKDDEYEHGLKVFNDLSRLVKGKDIALIVTDYNNVWETPKTVDGDYTEIELNLDVLDRTQALIYSGKERFVIEDVYDKPMESRGVFIIDAERRRQLYQEGYNAEHDRHHVNGEIADGAAVYALTDRTRDKYLYKLSGENAHVPTIWPFEPKSYKPTPDNRIRQLAKAGAMIAAEIDRLVDLRNN